MAASSMTRAPLVRWGAWLGVGLAIIALSACAALHGLTRQQDRAYASVPPGRYVIDPRHCSVIFSVDHLGFSDFTMRFDRVAGHLRWPAGGIAQATAQAHVDTSSIDTNDAELDAALRSATMLDAARHPTIDWSASGWQPTGRDHGDLAGVLALGRYREPLVLHVRFNGYGVDPVTGKATLGFSATGSFSRARLGLRAWPGFVGDVVHLRIEAEFVAAS
jgi:polyisoprenoid-binding protein YceI